MAQKITTHDLNELMEGKSPFALIDVRESGEYNATHIPGAALIPRRRIEYIIEESVPFKGTQVVICDDDGRRAQLAASTLEQLGYTNVSFLEGGTNRWASNDLPTEWGVNVPSKDFGEMQEVVHHVPEITADDLHQRIEDGEKLVILDTRTPEEYRNFCIPGGRSMPGGELALRITDIKKQLDPDTTVVINCAGRTRSIMGTRVLQRMGVQAVGLKNGTSGWLLAGYELEYGGDRLELPDVSGESRAAAEEYAAKLASEDGVRYLDIPALQQVLAKQGQESVYLVDVRTDNEYKAGHIPGFRHFPGGQAVQRSDDVAVVKNATYVFCCDGKARATVTASLYRQLGHENVFAVDGGALAWQAAGQTFETGSPSSSLAGLSAAEASVKKVSAQNLSASQPDLVLFTDTSEDFSHGHTPGAKWITRSWLEVEVLDAAPSKGASITVTCRDGRGSTLAAATLQGMGYTNITVLDGGMAAWRKAGLTVEEGLTGIVRPPSDINYLGVSRSYGEMMNYLRWETALGEKYAAD
ncbi:MAG: sulfurtransferase [Chloroflexi bacterium]|jgi:rhodanese-related sulfurtransferase|nr:sulfurtransferase [Chloroflexota bacterium]MDP6497062.1 rhodanese-like domain-containing protein [Dehalococcoidia bacterium]MQG54382.1 sulfurtransferase [SAR202 cluster bacterium]|tara:strand:- start:60536 stop:62113 length:1578 start_codon:yes stop_codon:yes gene_type:complete